MRLRRLLLGLALLASIDVNAASKCEEECEVENQKGFHRERPKCECGSGFYKSCAQGAYYAHTPSMCIYVSREEFTHEEAEKFCAKRFENSGFLAFVEEWDESYHIAHYVWNDLKQGVEGNETHYWLGGKFTKLERSKGQIDEFWSFDYRGYTADVPKSLFSDASRTAAEKEGKHCLTGHTKDYDTLHAMECTRKFPAVCYYYRETGGQYYCPQEDGTWVLFRGKCYYRYSAATTAGYKSWFQARDDCLKMNAKLVSIHDRVTNDKMMQISAGNEFIKTAQEATWIGLQTGCRFNETGNNECFVPSGGCYWHVGERPLLDENDPDPKSGVDRCSTTFDDTFLGRWEDGRDYNHTEVAEFWTPVRTE
ncbi:hypothetical protein AAVH_11185 [Aphelenchoides avenae]|nr:hypothetical protein AAVH_11185 [Aphelenchus avenae]